MVVRTAVVLERNAALVNIFAPRQILLNASDALLLRSSGKYSSVPVVKSFLKVVFLCKGQKFPVGHHFSDLSKLRKC